MFEPKGLAFVVVLNAKVLAFVVVGAPKAGVAPVGFPKRLLPVFPNTLFVWPNPVNEIIIVYKK